MNTNSIHSTGQSSGLPSANHLCLDSLEADDLFCDAITSFSTSATGEETSTVNFGTLEISEHGGVMMVPDEFDLKARCQRHVSRINGKLKVQNVLAIHPFHDELDRSTDRSKPTERLTDLFSKIDPNRFGRVLIDSMSHYALLSHKLVNLGLVDVVIFTQDGNSAFLNDDEYRMFSETTDNFFGGTYREMCVRGVVRNLRRFSQTRFKAIREAVLHGADVGTVPWKTKKLSRLLKAWDQIFGVESSTLLN